MAYISGVVAGRWSELFNSWWHWVLVALWLCSIAIGSAYIIFILLQKLWWRFNQQGRPSDDLRLQVAEHLQRYFPISSKSNESSERNKPTSLAVYLGTFQEDVSKPCMELSKRDMIILDPLAQNISAALAYLSKLPRKPSHLAGRIDINAIVTSHTSRKTVIASLDQVMRIVLPAFGLAETHDHKFNGIVFANWELFIAPVLQELCAVMSSAGLQVFLETAGPAFLEDPTILTSQDIAGLVVRNGLLDGNGERRDCFALEKLRTTVKSFISQSCVRRFTILAWETVDDDTVLSNAVLKRTFDWCSFYDAILWIGTSRALYDTSVEPIQEEPLSAFDWLKDPHIMSIQQFWKSQRTITRSNTRLKDSSTMFFPALKSAESQPTTIQHGATSRGLMTGDSSSETPEWFLLKDQSLDDPLCTSPIGTTYNSLGCFPIGLDIAVDDFQEVVFSQRNLRKLQLLDTVSSNTLREYGCILQKFLKKTNVPSKPQYSESVCIEDAVKDLIKMLLTATDEPSQGVRVFLGLQSGFQRTKDKQFWAVYHVHNTTLTTDVYISKDSSDVLSTLLHAYLSSRGLTRRQCLCTEVSFARSNKKLDEKHEIPTRLSRDIELLSPQECILLLQRIYFFSDEEKDPLLSGLKSAILERLVDIPASDELRVRTTVEYIQGTISKTELLQSRINWYYQLDQPQPSLASAIAIFDEVENKMKTILRNRNLSDLNFFGETLEAIRESFTATGDIFMLSTFCVMRKLAFDEVYYEVTDRNPLFNDQSDQAAAFAELFALGSRCQSYFDMTPSQMGELLSGRFRDHYMKKENQPPSMKDNCLALNSAYAEAQIDVDPNYKASEMPAYKRFTFLSVFAIPALIDILLLTSTGHGLYLSGSSGEYRYMSFVEAHSATMALMISLLLSGAIGTWVTFGGGYYLNSMAFSAMNYFVVTRLLGGFAFTLIVGLVGFIAFTITTSPWAGFVFFMYLILLTSYLSLLAALANYQFTGSSFQSGRAVIICCLPLLFISPLTTMFVPNHDIQIYLSVLSAFVFLLILGVRRTGAKWTTWYQNIHLVDDSELRHWYMERSGADIAKNLEKISDLAILRLARHELSHEVLSERKKWFASLTRTKDELVLKLAKSFSATEFLMEWYCRSTGVAKPILFSSGWNVQTKVALYSLQRSQLGIRFHNGFLHWRQAGDEMGCTMLYFIVALLDKWLSLLTGGNLVGLSNANTNLTLPVGLGLAYYLIGAVLLDFNSGKMFELAAKAKEVIVSNDVDITNAARVKRNNRRKVYWVLFSRYLLLHVWAITVTSTLIWLFSTTVEATLIYLSYILAYTGLLWYQYTKIFSGPHALKPLLAGVILGLTLGMILDKKAGGFLYVDIISLGVACWTVAILSLWAAKIVGQPRDATRKLPKSVGDYHWYSGPGADQAWSHHELKTLFDQVSDLSSTEKLPIQPDSAFGSEINSIFDKCSESNLDGLAAQAFPDAQHLVLLAKKLFKDRVVTVELISIDHYAGHDMTMRALSFRDSDSLRLIIGCQTRGILKTQDPLQAFYWDVASFLIQATAETYLAYSVRDACLVRDVWFLDAKTTVVTILEHQLHICQDSNNSSIVDLVKHLRSQLILDLCLGIDYDLATTSLTTTVKQKLIDRSLGKPISFTETEVEVINVKCNPNSPLYFETFLARRNYACFIGARSINLATSWLKGSNKRQPYLRLSFGHASLAFACNSPAAKSTLDLISTPLKYTILDIVRHYIGSAYHRIGTFFKFFAVALIADPEYQRELQCLFPPSANILSSIARGFFLVIWLWAKSIQQVFLPFFLLHSRRNVKDVWKILQGMEVSIKRHRVLIRNLDGVYTGFIHSVDRNTFRLLQYKGDHPTEPETDKDLCTINMYDKNLALLRRVELDTTTGNTVNDYEYEYRLAPITKRLSKADIYIAPIARKCLTGQDALQNIQYNSKGQIDAGSYMKDGNLVRFQYHYRTASRDGLLRAEFVLDHISASVSWCAPPRKRPGRLEFWVPHSQVAEATFVMGPDVWESKYLYDHRFHPTILTTLNGRRVDTPDFITYDHLDVLRKPKRVSFLDENPIYSFSTINTNFFTRIVGLSTRRSSVSTSQARSWLWKAWKEDQAFDGVIARWLDERLLRRDPVLKPYWRLRDLCKLEQGEAYLDNNRDAVMASVDLDNIISSWTPLAMKVNDLYTYGQGGDACSNTRTNSTTQDEDETALHVIAVDTGTWPNEGGGVAACRSDVINNLRSIKWHMVAEAANDFGIPKRQIERNIHSLKIIPLWGLDLLTPTHGLFANRLDSQVDAITGHMTLIDIERIFIPILKALVHSARAVEFSIREVRQATRALVNLNSYFKDSRHWTAVFKSALVKSAWRELWMSEMPNTRPPSQWLDTELPTLGQLDQGLDLWMRYLFIFSIPIPQQFPSIFQASHHSVSAAYGVVAKVKRGCTLQIWDHAISWRETNLYLSSSLSPLAPFVRNSLLGLMRMTSVLILHHADTILPCADFFNPSWEVEIGTCQGKIENRATFKRKIDPVVNGITSMERFAPVEEINTSSPTVTMLSHIWFAKDIKTALLSADIIVNKWGFKDYKLEVYGALDKSPAYTSNCQEIIATKSLRHNAGLMGEANPIDVLARTWVFLNSSVSEGLPLALGEAALTGAPVVCTDVGASLRVLTSPEGECYSEVIAPNDAHSMARAQIKLLALLEGWSKYADPGGEEDSSFPENPSAVDVARITRRMYEQKAARQRLGMRTREIVQKSFSGDRYLREHEQMLWIGKARKDMSMPRFMRPTARLMTPATVVYPTPVTPHRSSGDGIPKELSLPSLAFDSSIPTSVITDGESSSIYNGLQTPAESIKPGGGVRVVENNSSGKRYEPRQKGEIDVLTEVEVV